MNEKKRERKKKEKKKKESKKERLNELMIFKQSNKKDQSL